MGRLISTLLVLISTSCSCYLKEEIVFVDANCDVDSLVDSQIYIEGHSFSLSHFLHLDTAYAGKFDKFLEKPISVNLLDYYIADFTELQLYSSHKNVESVLKKGDVYFSSYLKQTYGIDYSKELIFDNKVLKSNNKVLVVLSTSQGEFCFILNLVDGKRLDIGLVYIATV